MMAAGVIGLGGQAGAAIIELDATVDLSKVFRSTGDTTLGNPTDAIVVFHLNTPVDLTIGAGDTLVNGVTFSSPLTATNLQRIVLGFDQSPFTLFPPTPATLDFLGAANQTLFTTTINASLGDVVFLAPALAGAPATFSGLRLTQAPNLSAGQTVHFAGDGLSVQAAALGAPDLNFPVPEPTSWALMILGFGAVGAALRRSRRALSQMASSH